MISKYIILFFFIALFANVCYSSNIHLGQTDLLYCWNKYRDEDYNFRLYEECIEEMRLTIKYLTSCDK
jgi:hypothetical protein